MTPAPSVAGDDRAPDGERVRVLVVDDHLVTRTGIIGLLSRADPALVVAGEAGSEEEAVSVWGTTRPDVVLMDLQMRDGDGIRAIARIRQEDRAACIVAVSAFASEELVAGAFRAGARGYIGKESSGIDFVRAIHAALRGEVVVAGAAVERLYAHLSDERDPLTEREREVLILLERGSMDREIAEELTISVKTVEKHVGSILRKLGAQNRTQAAARAREGARR